MAISEKRTDTGNVMSARSTNKTSPLDWVAVALVVIGGINWGLVGVFDFDLVAFLFGAMTGVARVVYVVVALAALYAIFSFAKLSTAQR
jgi:uncharacterized membrane protein YuzA (DUF378 family)